MPTRTVQVNSRPSLPPYLSRNQSSVLMEILGLFAYRALDIKPSHYPLEL